MLAQSRKQQVIWRKNYKNIITNKHLQMQILYRQGRLE